MSFFIKATVRAAASVMSFAPAFLPAHAATPATVKVGVILPLTGPNADIGRQTLNGIEFALEKLGATAPKIELSVQDTLGKPEGAAQAMNKLVTSDKVSVVVGEIMSSNTIAASAIAQSSKIPLLSPGSTNDTITKGKDFVSRICFIDSFQGKVMAKFASGELKAKTAVMLVDSDADYSRGLAASFKQAFEAAGGKIIDEVSYSQKDTDYKGQLIKLRKQKPDVVFVPGYYSQVGVIFRQARELKIESKFLGGDGWDSPDLFKIAGKSASGHYMSNHFSHEDTDPRVQGFVASYKKKYGRDPNAFGALGYDAIMIVHAAVKAAGSADPAKIKDAINATKDFQGVTGQITLDADRNAVKSAVVLETTDSMYKFRTKVAP